jgi:glycerol-3-phosphate dehydrogenase
VAPNEGVWTYSGVRPLLDDESGNPAAVTRDYRLEFDTGPGDAPQAPLLSVWGGKITTFRKLAEEAADRLVPVLAGAESGDAPARPAFGTAWTAGAPLPGGDLRGWLGADAPAENEVEVSFERFVTALAARHPALPAKLVRRLARAYGTRAGNVLEGELGAEVAPQVFEAELKYLCRVEWARTGEDVLWRRSKLGLRLSAAEGDAVTAWMSRFASLSSAQRR